MIKNLVSISLLASLVLLSTGCGGGGSSDNNTTIPADNNNVDNNESNKTQSDTTPPRITNLATYTVEEDTNKTIHLTANEDVNFSMAPTPHFTLIDANLTFSAPEFNTSTNAVNEYNATVTATDTSGNDTNKTFSFIVIRAASGVVDLGDKALVRNSDGTVTGPTGLKWDDATDRTGRTYSQAENDCPAPKRLPLANELLNILNFEKASQADHGSLLEDEFANSHHITEFWAQEQNGKRLFVNVAHGGVGVEENATAIHAVKCVEGDIADDHTITVEADGMLLDETTRLVWKPIDHRLTGNDLEGYCTGEWRFPNINELRTLITKDGELYTEFGETGDSTDKISNIWSNTEFQDQNTSIEARLYNINAMSIPLYVNVGSKSSSHYVTCVK